jgi:hypothetical protein
MSQVEAVRLVLPCPTCRVPHALTASFVAAADDGDTHAVLRECTRCWSRRALALNDARARLRRSGELGDSGSVLTWRGELVDDAHEHDALQGALLSELLRRDIPAAQEARLRLPSLVAADVAGTTR